MNKRQWKKFESKHYEKSWYAARLCEIKCDAYWYALYSDPDITPMNHSVHIIDSKRGNLKHPLKIITTKLSFNIDLPKTFTFNIDRDTLKERTQLFHESLEDMIKLGKAIHMF